MAIDWSKAPADATHCNPKDPSEPWRKLLPGGVWEALYNGNWVVIVRAPEVIYEPRPAAAWKGEGLPPVGTVCEYRGTGIGGVWQHVEIIAHWRAPAAQVAVYIPIEDGIHSGDTGRAIAETFRPIRTPKQIEQYERDAHEMAYLMTGHRDRSKDSFLTLAKILLDAGYRKVGDQ